jgi:hypothetical protein
MSVKHHWQESMFESATDSPKPRVSRGLLCLRLMGLGVVAALFMATSAGAAVGTEPLPGAEASESAPLSGETGGSGGTLVGGGEVSQGLEQPPAGETTPPVETPPAGETKPLAEPPPAQSPAEPQLPAVLEQTQETVPVMPLNEEQQISGTAAVTGEESSKTTQNAVDTSLASVDGDTAIAGSEGSAVVGAISESQPPGPPSSTATPLSPRTITISAAAAARGRGRQPAERLSCELADLGDSLIQSCAAAWMGAPGAGGRSSSSQALGGPSLSASGSSRSPDGNAESPAVNNRPLAPAPGGSAPSGSAGGVAAGGSGGLGLSAFLTIAGLLLLAAPHAMRRLRLSCLPWRTAFFVLIPERPG